MDDFVPPVWILAFSFSNFIYGVGGASHRPATPHPEEQVDEVEQDSGTP
jgi:hypothetical protein